MNNKKAELTSKQLITIIILIVSFSIIIAFFVMINLGSEIDKEACRNSVMMKGVFAEVPAVGGLVKNIINLKCETEKICFSMGGDCYEYVDVDRKIEVEDLGELQEEMKILEDDCWWMFGEGKVKYGNKGDCAICYRIYFSEDAEEIGTINLKPQVYDLTNLPSINGYALVTGIKNDKSYFEPVFVEYSAEKLKDLGCSNFVTEV